MATPAVVSQEPGEQAVTGIANLLLKAESRFPASGLHLISGDVTSESEFVSHSELLREARRILGGLQICAGGPAGKVALLLDRPRDFIPAFWACILGGFIPCPLAPIRSDPDRWEKHLAHVELLLDRPLFVGTGALLDELPPSASSVDLDDLRRSQPHYFVKPAAPSDPAVLMLTSGSTGNSKAVELTHGNLQASMAGRAERQRLTHADITLNWIAFDHVAALLESHMIALYVAATQVHVEPAVVLTDPLQFLRLIDRYRVSLAFAPNFLLGQINAALQAACEGGSETNVLALDLSCLRRIVTGGEANVVETGRRFLELLAPYGLSTNALWPAFGMTETCAAAVYSHEFPDIDANKEFAAVGVSIPGFQARIVDEQGLPCPEGQAGELQVSGPMVFRKYYNNDEATRAAFTADGWFRTGDVGRVDAGRLSLVARNKDSIIVNGVNYYSHELETRLEQLAGIERSYVAAFPTRPEGADTELLVVTFATTIRPDDDELLYQLLVAVRNTTIMLWGFRPAAIIALPKSAFPKTSLGKIQRSLMRKRFEAGEYAAELDKLASLTMRQAGAFVAPSGPTEEAIAEIFAKILKLNLTQLSATASFFDMGGTSLDILKFTRALEKRLGLKTGLPLVLQNPSVRELARHAASTKHRAHAYDPIVPMQVTGKKTPLFCVHPGNGEVFVLTNLAKYFLNDRPFLALRPRGFNEGERCFESPEEMIATYVDAIVNRQPLGPYAIAGYSLGGQIAFEVGKELEARGHEVAFLGCIDGRPLIEKRTLEFNMATGLALVIDLITKAQFDELRTRLRPELPADEVCAQVFRLASPARLAELDLDLQKFSVWSRVAHSVETLLFSYITSGTVQAMTIFCSEGMNPRYTGIEAVREVWRKELQPWDKFVLKPKYIDVAGNHHTLMGPKHVASFQAVLRARIEEALGGR